MAKMPIDARDAIADAILQGRFRYAARLLFLWRERMTTKDEKLVQADVESFGSCPVAWEWGKENQVLTIKYQGDFYPYRETDTTEERWNK